MIEQFLLVFCIFLFECRNWNNDSNHNNFRRKFYHDHYMMCCRLMSYKKEKKGFMFLVSYRFKNHIYWIKYSPHFSIAFMPHYFIVVQCFNNAAQNICNYFPLSPVGKSQIPECLTKLWESKNVVEICQYLINQD